LPLSVEPAILEFISEERYHIENDTEWATLVPAHRARVRLGAPPQELGVALFSDLACLDVVRRAFLQMRSGAIAASPAAEACLGQLRQAIVCTADSTLEPARIVCEDVGRCGGAASGETAHRCRNWAQVREFVEANQATWAIDYSG
ncbi:hypothetical protein GGX14DRAFT_369707, partial [Mycena pura]